MAALYGTTWTSQYGGSPDGICGLTWASVLSGLTAAQIGNGIEALCRTGGDWPPSAPKFRALCLGIPSLAHVRHELRPGNPEPSPFCRLVWNYLDAYAYRQANADSADRMVRDAYDLAREYVMAGNEMPEVMGLIAPIEEAPIKPADPETAKRYLDQMAQTLGVANG